MDSEVKKIISQLYLKPHPEGGYFRETYRSNGLINENNLRNQFSGNRNYSTAIYFLLTSNIFSAFHCINQDEVWHFYKGSPIKLHIISSKGIYSNVIIGSDLLNGQLPQYVVAAKDWFAAEVINHESYALVGCTVAPGFDFNDFKLASRTELISKFPQHEQIITKFTRN